MTSPPKSDVTVAARAPTGTDITAYDRAHFVTYLRLLDADADGAEWEEVSRIVLGLDPSRDRGAARLTFETHLARAKWMSESGYRELLNRAGKS
ncbi:DNA -binding domain-containing protein [Aestuariibius insulae]|uniref:DNA -binding domain-containing protein n=1 Tax=Aestuariibius insulae TaxID=2058287 RepID=UPI00345E4C15